MSAEHAPATGAPPAVELSDTDRRLLLQLAVTVLRDRLDGRSSAALDVAGWPATLREVRATFVTLRRQGELRGCCGTVRAREPLGRDVVRSALTAAFADPRFPPLEPHEFADLDLHVSILSRPERLSILTEADLVAAVRPGVDGLILSDESHQGVFLPSVWEQIATPREFVRRLKQKAGLSPDDWSPWLRVERFTAESIHGAVDEIVSRSSDISG